MSLYYLEIIIGLAVVSWGIGLTIRRGTLKHCIIYGAVTVLYCIWVAVIFAWNVKRPY